MLFRVEKGLEGDPEFAGGIMLQTWPDRVLEFHVAELPLFAKDRDPWRSRLELLFPQPQKDKRAKGNTKNTSSIPKNKNKQQTQKRQVAHTILKKK